MEINPHISKFIEIRRVHYEGNEHRAESGNGEKNDIIRHTDAGKSEPVSVELESAATSYHGPHILLGVVKEGERFDFCMCNPPFFETINEAGLNPKTACGGTPNEMVCPGGEQAFITRIIEDSVQLKQSFRYCVVALFFVPVPFIHHLVPNHSYLLLGGTLQWLEENQI